MRSSEVVDNTDGWSSFTALNWATVAIPDVDDNYDNFTNSLYGHIKLRKLSQCSATYQPAITSRTLQQITFATSKYKDVYKTSECPQR